MGEFLRVRRLLESPSLAEVPQGSEELGGTIEATALYGNPGEMAASVVHLVSAQCGVNSYAFHTVGRASVDCLLHPEQLWAQGGEGGSCSPCR